MKLKKNWKSILLKKTIKFIVTAAVTLTLAVALLFTMFIVITDDIEQRTKSNQEYIIEQQQYRNK